MDRAAMFMAALLSRSDVHGSDEDLKHLAERSLAAVAALEREERYVAGLKTYMDDWDEAIRMHEYETAQRRIQRQKVLSQLVNSAIVRYDSHGHTLPDNWESWFNGDDEARERFIIWLWEDCEVELARAKQQAQSKTAAEARAARKAAKRAELEKNKSA